MTNLPVPVPATVAPGQLITGALFNAQVGNANSFMLNVPLFAGYASTAQSIGNNAFVALTMDTNRYDTYAGHSTSSNPSRYVAPVSGYYLVFGQSAWAPSATGQRAIGIAKNGSQTNGAEQIIGSPVSATGAPNQIAMSIVQLNAGDYVELWIWQNTGGALSTSSTGNWQPGMSVFWIHA